MGLFLPRVRHILSRLEKLNVLLPMLSLQPRSGRNAEERLHVRFVQLDGFVPGCPELEC
jgi:hypothetical protein